MRRLVVVLVVSSVLGGVPAASGAVVGGPPAGTPVMSGAQPDFNGDGLADLVTGIPGEDVGGATNAGAVSVIYGSAPVLSGGSDLFSQNSAAAAGSAESGDRFGSAVAVGDFDGDGFTDAAVGAPGEDVFAVVDAGAINVLYGSGAGLSGAGGQVFTQDTAGVAGSAERGDRLGSALASGDFDADGFADLAAGVPGENVFAISNGGAVNVLYGSADGLTGSGSQLFTQDSPDVNGSVEAGDGFGAALATGDFSLDGFVDLAVGSPAEDVFGATDAGMANLLAGSVTGLAGGPGNDAYTQNLVGVGGRAEAGDGFGRALAAFKILGTGDALVIGAPGEDVGAVADAGLIYIFTGGALWIFTENTPGIPGSAEPGDRFGDSLAAGRLGAGGVEDLAIGAPGEGPGAGAVIVINGGTAELDPATVNLLVDQDSPGVVGTSEAGDSFGDAVAASR